MFVCIVGTILIASVFQWLVFVPGVDTGNLLFKRVSSLAGGRSAVISKENQNVRIALDPAGNNIIATYSNDVASHGGVVFDAGFDRFTAAAKGIEDDRRYVVNIADWLQQCSSFPDNRKILIYTIARGAKKSSLDIGEGLTTLLQRASFNVTQLDRTRAPKLTDLMLKDAGQLWLFFPDSNGEGRLSEDEMKLITSYNERGNGMLVSLENSSVDTNGVTPVNLLTSRYGVQFSGVATNNPRISIGIGAQMLSSASEILGRLLKIVHKA
jgi:hypothetical protein